MGIELFMLGDEQKSFDKEGFKRSVKFEISVTLWVCVTEQGQGRCIISTKVNSNAYQEMC